MKGHLNRFPSASLGRESLILFLLSAGSACLLGIGTPQAFSHTQAPKSVHGTITFAERVGYQFAIEDVYWRHRIWPKENPEPKPPLDAMISGEEVEKKVTDYLRKSQALADYWQQPITAAQLQAEIDRMAHHTKQPEVLRGLFEALGKDPFVIAECLARPILAERLVSDLTRTDESNGIDTLKSYARTRSHSQNFAKQDDVSRISDAILWSAMHRRVAFGLYPSVRRISLNARDEAGATSLADAAYKLPEISAPLDCTDDTWTATTVINVPDPRYSHSAVWTGSEMIVWGGEASDFVNTGGRYNPSTDSWIATSTTNAPSARARHTAVWTGSEMIVWGGLTDSSYDLNTGGRYNPGTDSWIATSMINPPTARSAHTAVWIGSEMIVWGGYDGSYALNTGGRYNPGTDSWTVTSTTNAPTGREFHTTVWTGSEMIVWGGVGDSGSFNTGGRYNPGTDKWTSTSTTNVPSARYAHTAVWTGSEVIIWGGFTYPPFYFNTGGRYNPGTDSWTATSLIGPPTARSSHTAVWTGSEMIVWGGRIAGGFLSTGNKYDPSTNSWTATSSTNAPSARYAHTAVWTGSEMIVWGGEGGPPTYLNTGGRYCAQPSTPIVQSVVSRKMHGGTGIFDIALPLNGTAGIECRNGGATNDYTMVVTFLANVSVTGNPQAAVTSGVGIVGTGGLSNGGRVMIASNVVTVPLTNVANAQTIQVTLYGVNGSTNFAIPMSILIGDVNGNAVVNATDVALTKSQVGMAVTGSNFRDDVNANGTISATDVAIVKSDVGTSLPP